jgi:predicted nucleic acid-binding protein
MLVVSDASPLNYLVRIGHECVLPALFSRVLVPVEVARELSQPGTPEIVRAFIRQEHDWLEIAALNTPIEVTGIHVGEAAAIGLARERGAEAILVDDRDARRVATSLGLPVIGTLGVLRGAAERDLIRLESALASLLATDFRVSGQLIDQVLAEHRLARASREVKALRPAIRRDRDPSG